MQQREKLTPKSTVIIAAFCALWFAGDVFAQDLAEEAAKERRQVGVIDMKGRTAQWTGSEQYGAEAQ